MNIMLYRRRLDLVRFIFELSVEPSSAGFRNNTGLRLVGLSLRTWNLCPLTLLSMAVIVMGTFQRFLLML